MNASLSQQKSDIMIKASALEREVTQTIEQLEQTKQVKKIELQKHKTQYTSSIDRLDKEFKNLDEKRQLYSQMLE